LNFEKGVGLRGATGRKEGTKERRFCRALIRRSQKKQRYGRKEIKDSPTKKNSFPEKEPKRKNPVG